MMIIATAFRKSSPFISAYHTPFLFPFLQHIYMASGVMKARKAFNIPYPTLYAESSDKNAKEFNCVQRAHQNSLENLISFYPMLILAGVRFPVTATVAGLLYNFGRVLYFNGYCTGDPKKRMNGWPQYFASFTLLGAVFRFAYELIRSTA
jgi:glutathione S-transferase